MMHICHCNIALSLVILALVASMSLLIWSMRNIGTGIMLAKLIGGVCSLLAIILMVCSIYHMVQFYQNGGADMMNKMGMMHESMNANMMPNSSN
ncbi:MAG TPA: hypothetical protein PKD00_09125 [Burkholderiales bacterium]|nr:hypothetical protein [Burkholderiales bacterium]